MRNCSDKPESLHYGTGSRSLGKDTFGALCIYVILLALIAICILLAQHRALGAFLRFDDFYIVVVFIESMVGVFILPFMIRSSSGIRILPHALAGRVMIFSAGTPFVVVGAYCSATPAYGVVTTQILVFSIWTVAAGTREFLARLPRTEHFYVPAAALLFFGLLVTGKILAGFSTVLGVISSYSVPGVLDSWNGGRYFGMNGWLGVAACLGALVLWSRRFMAGVRQ